MSKTITYEDAVAQFMQSREFLCGPIAGKGGRETHPEFNAHLDAWLAAKGLEVEDNRPRHKSSGAVDKHGIMGQYEKVHVVLLYNHLALGIEWGDVRTLLVLMAHKWTESSKVFPTIRALAEECCLAKTAVGDSVNRLIQAGLVERNTDDKGRSVYTFNGLRDRINEYVDNPAKLDADHRVAVAKVQAVRGERAKAGYAKSKAKRERAAAEKEARGGSFGLDKHGLSLVR
jgi:predicted transcriptional regulator